MHAVYPEEECRQPGAMERKDKFFVGTKAGQEVCAGLSLCLWAENLLSSILAATGKCISLEIKIGAFISRSSYIKSVGTCNKIKKKGGGIILGALH